VFNYIKRCSFVLDAVNGGRRGHHHNRRCCTFLVSDCLLHKWHSCGKGMKELLIFDFSKKFYVGTFCSWKDWRSLLFHETDFITLSLFIDCLNWKLKVRRPFWCLFRREKADGNERRKPEKEVRQNDRKSNQMEWKKGKERKGNKNLQKCSIRTGKEEPEKSICPFTISEEKGERKDIVTSPFLSSSFLWYWFLLLLLFESWKNVH